MRRLGLGLGFYGRRPQRSATQVVTDLLREALIPTRDGVLTVTSTATVDPGTSGAVVPANTANGRDVRIGSVTLVGAALRAERAVTGLVGPASTNSGLLSNTAAAGTRPTERTLVEDTSTGQHAASTATATIPDATDHTIQAEVRRGVGARNVLLMIDRGGVNRAGATFDFDAMTATSFTAGNGTMTRASLRLLSNGNYLCQITGKSAAWGGTVSGVARFVQGAATFSYAGDGVSSLIISALQLVLGPYAVMPLGWDGSLGVARLAQLNSWNQALSLTAGTVVAVGMPYGRSGLEGALANRLYDEPTDLSLMFYDATTTGIYRAQRNDSAPTVNGVVSAIKLAVAGQQKIVCQRFDATSNRITVDGVTVSSAAPTLPFAAATPIIVGNRAALDRYFDGWVFAPMWNRALSEFERQAWEAAVTIL